MTEKIKAAPEPLRQLYEKLSENLGSFGDDVKRRPQKLYIAYRRKRNFACVRVLNQSNVLKIYLNLDPDIVELDKSCMRDVRQIGHFGTGDLELTIQTDEDLDRFADLFAASYANS